MKKILVTGASGFVGSRFVQRWHAEYKILAPSHREMDITLAASVDNYVKNNTPDVVLHLAAISNTWHCEQHPDESYLVNVVGAENVARAAARYGAKLVFFSSDQVYNGNPSLGLLKEDEAINPASVYACHKLQAEARIAAISPDAVMLRATWMYDAHSDTLPRHTDFVYNIAHAIEQRKPLSMPVREFRGITWVKEVVENLPATFSLDGGAYNFGAENIMNTYETACCYCEMLGVDRTAGVVLPDYERYPTHVRNISISVDKVFRASGGCVCFQNTIDGLRLFLDVTLGRC